FFIEDFIATVAVVADGGAGDQHAWPAFAAGQGFAYVPGSEDAAMTNALFFLFGPASEDVFPGKVDNGIEAAGLRGIQRLSRVPGNFILGTSSTSFQACNGVSFRGERRQQCLPNGSRHAAGQNLHGELLLRLPFHESTTSL